tara:strand:+ start:1360 stop:1734 length:375 start_codon:yes stop_codon:yes gene_type:complete
LAVDKFFKSLERRTERDLYRKAFKASRKSQNEIYNVLSGGVKKERRKNLAKEILWFFISIAVGFVIGYTVYEVVLSFSRSFTNDLIKYLQFSKIEFIYLLSLVCFIGVYLTRITIWALNLISER